MQVVTYARAEHIPGPLWDSIAPPDFFFSRAFLRVMEESRVEEASYRYVVLLDDDLPVGLAVLSAFVLRLDLLARDAWIRGVRVLFPRLLDVPIVCCGIPASYGQHHLHVVRLERAAEVVRLVDETMEAWARDTGSTMLFWKEWRREQDAYRRIAQRGYIALPTLPDHWLRGLPDCVDTFLTGLRSPYRRKYRATADLMRGPGPVWSSDLLQLEDVPFGVADADDFHRGYVSVLERAAVRLETYPTAFFHNLARSPLDVRMLRLRAHRTGQSVSALVVPSGQALTFLLAAKERAWYEDALYSRLLQCIVLYAVRGGFAEVRLGQTSSYAKGCLGAEPLQLQTFVRLRKRWQHTLLKRFGHALFPDTTVPRFHVFLDGHSRRPHPRLASHV